jgi:hypothetical protein
MGKNGHQPHDILTLEEALIRFKRKRDEARARAQTNGKSHPESKVRYADFSASIKREGEEKSADSETKRADDVSANAPARRDDSNAGAPAADELVAVISGIPRSLEELEHIATADRESTELVPTDPFEDAEIIESYRYVTPRRHLFSRDYGFTLMGTALMTLVAVMMMRVPIVSDHARPILMAQSIATPALKASSPLMSADDLITTLVIIPDTDVQLASIHRVKPDVLEAQIKDTLKESAFTDIGVSVSKRGEAFLAGEVYSMDEAHKIEQIVHTVNGVRQVHFMHPDVHQASGPAYFGAMTAWAPNVWGAKVRSVSIGSPADKSGIKAGDVISEFDGKTIPDAKTLNDIVAQYTPGQRVQFRVWHKGQPEYLVARLGESTTMASR